MVAAEIRLDLSGKIGPDLWARLGESDTRQIVIHPGYYDPDGNWTPLIIDAENIFAKFRIVKPDNTFVIIDASLYLPSDPSIFVVTLPETATQVAGLGYYDLRIGDGETPDTFLYSGSGRFIIDDDMLTDEMIASVASVNGLIFPDDFLTSADLEDYVTESELSETLDDYATKNYVDTAISHIETIHAYSETEKIVGKWINGKDIYEKTIVFPSEITISYSSWTQVTSLLAADYELIVKALAINNAGTYWGEICAALNIGTYVNLLCNRNYDTIGVKYLVLQYTKP